MDQAISSKPITVSLDSNCLYGAFLGSGGLAFRTLSALGEKKLIQICLSEIVLREVTTQAIGKVREAAQAVAKNLETLRQHSMPELEEKLGHAKANLEVTTANSEKSVINKIEEWVRRCNVKILPVQGQHTPLVLNAYFAGEAPFKSIKNRNDIPDAFIWQTLLDLINGGEDDIQLVCNDGAVHDHSGRLEQVTAHKDIASLLKSGNLPITADEKDYEFTKAFRSSPSLIEEIARKAIQRSAAELQVSIPVDVSPSGVQNFVVERILALKEVKLDGDSVVPLGSNTLSLAFKYSATIRASFSAESVRQEGTFDILKSGKVRSDYEVKGRAVLLMKSDGPAGDVLDGVEAELEEFSIVTCIATPAEFADVDDDGVGIVYNAAEMEAAIEARKGLVLVIGRLKKKRIRAASVLLNDVAVHHPDALYLATHGSAVATSIRSVMPLDRRGFEHDEEFMNKLVALDPDAITLEIGNEEEMGLAFRLITDREILVLGITTARTETELEQLTDTLPLPFIKVVAK